mmetsp:Transcript_7457/g.18246  ORF Transcript_7457/g.18246 Transcript_7457/m.18246 type:complete len:246 (-) Transcript_7457:1450-2187(-)
MAGAGPASPGPRAPLQGGAGLEQTPRARPRRAELPRSGRPRGAQQRKAHRPLGGDRRLLPARRPRYRNRSGYARGGMLPNTPSQRATTTSSESRGKTNCAPSPSPRCTRSARGIRFMPALALHCAPSAAGLRSGALASWKSLCSLSRLSSTSRRTQRPWLRSSRGIRRRRNCLYSSKAASRRGQPLRRGRAGRVRSSRVGELRWPLATLGLQCGRPSVAGRRARQQLPICGPAWKWRDLLLQPYY